MAELTPAAHLCLPAAIQLQLQGEDGSVMVREWRICKHTVDDLAAQLGAVDREWMFTAEARNAAIATITAMPGVVMSEADRG